jgi:hypothetical protein
LLFPNSQLPSASRSGNTTLFSSFLHTFILLPQKTANETSHYLDKTNKIHTKASPACRNQTHHFLTSKHISSIHPLRRKKKGRKKMVECKPGPFRICIAFLLIIQLACWALTLLDLLQPGKPRALLRTALDVVAQVFLQRRPGVVLRWSEVVGRGVV